MLSIGTEDFPLLFDHIFELDQCLGVSYDLLLAGLFVEEIVVKLSKVVVHILTSCVF